MISFYDHLGMGEAKDEALHNAKLDYIANTSDANLQHPYYWAGFVISGDTTPMRISTPSNGYVAWGALILGTLGLGFFYFRRKKKAA
jgi:LPXTG-motif cell wall-anchored protein